MPMLAGLSAQRRSVSFLGCLEGCLKFLGPDVSAPWLYGASGHAFCLNIHRELCPSSPHVWSGFGNLNGLEPNVRCELEPFGPHYRETDEEYVEHKQEAWDWTRRAIDEGSPCLAYDLRWGEWYIVNGYDDVGYHYLDWFGIEEGLVRWQDLGDTGVVHMIYNIRVDTCEAPDNSEAIYDALAFAVEFGRRAPEPGSDYVAGLRAYDTWIRALSDLGEDTHGAAYNSQVWFECRAFAVEFLELARTLADEPLRALFDAPVGDYQVVADNLRRVSDLFPVGGRPPDMALSERVATACQCLTLARMAEDEGLDALQKVVERM